MDRKTLPATLPADPNTAATLPPASGSAADLNLALLGFRALSLRAPRVPSNLGY